MTWLLDVSVLVAKLLVSHEHNPRVAAWWPGRSVALCPITELGFLRVAAGFRGEMADVRAALADFIAIEKPLFIPCDRRALQSAAITSPRKTTDIYLADLAASRGFRFATLDAGIVHPAVDLLPGAT